MFCQVEGRKAAQQRPRQTINLVASLGRDALAIRRERAKKARAVIVWSSIHQSILALAKEFSGYGIALGLMGSWVHWFMGS